jgi:hypothetical protein
LTLATVIIVAVTAIEPADAREKIIVGLWALDPKNCTPASGMIGIEPLGMVGDEFRCDFDSVIRAGNTVVWNGRCSESSRPSTVVARTTGTAVYVRINGGDNGRAA